tara:strand:- start:24174 stop:24596 length:423 start_codon:yes stop_codon:yes gene_type:complete
VAAQCHCTGISDGNVRWQLNGLQQVGGNDQILFQTFGFAFEPCGGVHRVPVINDGPLGIAARADNDRSTVQACADSGPDAKQVLIGLGIGIQDVLNRKETAHTAAFPGACLKRPRDDCFIANVGMNFAPVFARYKYVPTV